jgi:hypothetical protein
MEQASPIIDDIYTITNWDVVASDRIRLMGVTYKVPCNPSCSAYMLFLLDLVLFHTCDKYFYNLNRFIRTSILISISNVFHQPKEHLKGTITLVHGFGEHVSKIAKTLLNENT